METGRLLPRLLLRIELLRHLLGYILPIDHSSEVLNFCDLRSYLILDSSFVYKDSS